MDYSKVTMLEYQAKKKAILDSLGRTQGFCSGVECSECPFEKTGCQLQGDCFGEFLNPLEAVKLVMDYEIPIDWDKTKKDTLIFVRDTLFEEEIPRYFAKYENGTIWAFNDGCTSRTTIPDNITNWKYARLAESEE